MALSHLALRSLAFALLLALALPRAHAQPARPGALLARPAAAAPAAAPAASPELALPPLLAPWVPWVLEDAGDARCPLVDGQHVCTWPGSLALDVTGNAATFVMRVYAARDLAVALPGAREQWPIDVLVDGAALPVREPGGVPTVDLARGSHTISGRFLFAEAPSTLRLPANVGALSLRRNGSAVAHPRREADGLLWLEEGTVDDDGEQRLTLSVHRRLEDALPLRVITRIGIRAAGKSREVLFDDVLIEGTRPIELRSTLPAQLSPDGALRMQVEGGSYQVELVSILDQAPKALSAPKLPAPWPEQEVWVFRADDALRHVELSGPPQVDAARTDLAVDWRGLPTFLVAPGQPLALEVRRRGEQEPAPNELRLQRSLWLDLDGDGYTVRDQLAGRMHQGFRIDLVQGALGRAVVNDEDALITQHGRQSGVELRTSQVALTTEWRLEHGQRDLPAVGYDEDVDQLSATLHLPPGYLLLAASGSDEARGTWFDRWDLFDFFFVLAIALAVGKLCGAWWGALALLALVLAQHEPNAPAGSWIFLLASCALVRAVSREGRAATLTRLMLGIAAVTLVVQWVPFAAQQVRSALYPQLANQLTQASFDSVDLHMAREAAPMEEAGAGAIGSVAPGSVMESIAVSEPMAAAARDEAAPYRERQLIDPSAIVQTGPGIPNWSFQQHQLNWSGPVTRAERLHLWLVPPLATRAWALGSAVLTGLLLFGLLNVTRSQGPTPGAPLRPRSSSPGSEVAVTLLCALLCFAPRAQAQGFEPRPELLNELRQRLLQPPTCTPNCVAVPALSLDLGENRLDVRVELHASAGADYRAPGPLAQWSIDRVRIDGADAFGAARLADGFLHVRVPAGIHRLELSGPVPSNQSWTLALGGPAPHRVEAQAHGWLIEGLHPDGSAEPNLELRPEVTSTQKEGGAQALVQWLEVKRELELGLRFLVRTTVTRLGPASEGITLRLPLWADESVNEAGLRAEGGNVLLNLPRDQSTLSFVSSLPPTSKLQIRAATPMQGGVLRHPYSEHWVIEPGPLYRVSMDGVPALAQVDQAGDYAASYRPYPGEQLTILAERLAAEPGASVTIDRAELALRPGARSEHATLTLSLRASQGTTETVSLARDEKLVSVEVDGQPHPARAKDGSVQIPLAPGAHVIQLTTERASEMQLAYSPAAPTVKRPLSNVRVNVTLPDDRWLLATRGPAWGPAIVWWGYLVLVMLIGLALGRVPTSPLRSWQWMLLGLGLARVAPPVALTVVGWFFALAYRERDRIRNVRLFYLVQLLLIIYTVIALSCLTYAVRQGLLVSPDMQVIGMLSTQNFVQWYVDRTSGQLPEVTVWSAPLWIYKSLMLVWALWLAASLVQWLRWGWAAFRKGGATRSPPGGSLFGRGARGGPMPGSPAGARAAGTDSERAGVP